MTVFSLNPSHSYIELGRPWYDTKAGVAVATKTLSGLLNLKKERHQAGYIRKERLNELYILGDYFFDTIGNCLVASPSVKKSHPDISDVMTHEEYWDFLNDKGKDKFGSFAYDVSIPSEHVRCPICAKGWSIKNINDVVVCNTYDDFNLDNFIGKSLGEVREFYRYKTDANYYIGTEPFLQNDSFIDNSPWTLDPKSELEKTMVKNSDGRVGTKDGITDDYIIKQNDNIHFTIIHYYHNECNSKKLEMIALNYFKDFFIKVGYSEIQLKSIPNEYCRCSHCAPWFEVTTEFGTIKIGQRKRVVNIDCSRLNRKIDSLMTIFSGEDVTTGETFIHAWTDEKIVEYLTKILSYCKDSK